MPEASPSGAFDNAEGRRTRGVRSGGRSARVRRAVLDATIDELAETGHEALSVPRIAEAAGVARSTVVRRWPTKEALLAEAVDDLARRAREGFSVPDLGSARAELAYLASALVSALGDRRMEQALRTMLAVPGEAMEQARADHTAARRRVLGEIVDRAVGRGELKADTDPLHLGDLLTSPIWMQTFMHDQPVDQALIDRVVTDALARFSIDLPAESRLRRACAP